MENNSVKKNNESKKVVNKKTVTEYYNKLCYEEKYSQNKLFICLILSSVLSVSAMFSVMKISLSYRDERIAEVQSNLESYKTKIQSIMTVLDNLINDVENIKNDVKINKESSSDSLVRLAGLLKDVQTIKNALNLNNDTKQNSTEENLNNLSSEKRDFIEAFENLIKDGVPFSNFIEKIDSKKYTSINKLLTYKDTNIKSIESLKKDFTAIGVSVFGNQVKESFWQKQFRIFKEKISNAIRIESSNGKIQNLGNNLDDKVLFEKAQNYINNEELEESYELLSKIKSNNENIATLKSDLSNRIELNKAFKQFKLEFIENEIRN